jgi:hypothetical protein
MPEGFSVARVYTLYPGSGDLRIGFKGYFGKNENRKYL